MLEISARLIEDKDIQKIVCGTMIVDVPEKDVLYEPPHNQRRARN
jgi:hypothetical protein